VSGVRRWAGVAALGAGAVLAVVGSLLPLYRQVPAFAPDSRSVTTVQHQTGHRVSDDDDTDTPSMGLPMHPSVSTGESSEQGRAL
jgi:hypothetical protein